MPLTLAEVRALKPREKGFRKFDNSGTGLHVFVSPKGAKLWRMKYTFAGRESTLTFGVFPAVSIADARRAADAARAELRAGRDPGALKRESKLRAIAEREHTFAGVAARWMAEKASTWSPASTKRCRELLAHADKLDGRSVAAITHADVHRVVTEITQGNPVKKISPKPATAVRTFRIIGAVMRFAIAEGLCTTDPTAVLVGAGRAPKGKATTDHRPYIESPETFGQLLRGIRAYGGATTTRIALELAILTVVRSNELRCAQWSEFDLEHGLWTIPGARMKGRHVLKEKAQPHVVPLSRQALALVRELREIVPQDRVFLFPNVAKPLKKPMSKGTLITALASIGFPGSSQTVHGFRSAFAAYMTKIEFSADAIEACLAHVLPGSNVRRAYVRPADNFIELRTRALQIWADYCDEMREGKVADSRVVSIMRGRAA